MFIHLGFHPGFIHQAKHALIVETSLKSFLYRLGNGNVQNVKVYTTEI